jgi:hypothetical protein
MNQKVLQEVENAMVDAVMDSAASLGLTPLQRAKFIVAISETLIDAITPYVQHQDAAPPAKVVRRRGPRKAKAAAAIVKTMTDAGAAAVAPPPDQPAPFKGPPAAAQPFSA